MKLQEYHIFICETPAFWLTHQDLTYETCKPTALQLQSQGYKTFRIVTNILLSDYDVISKKFLHKSVLNRQLI